MRGKRAGGRLSLGKRDGEEVLRTRGEGPGEKVDGWCPSAGAATDGVIPAPATPPGAPPAVEGGGHPWGTCPGARRARPVPGRQGDAQCPRCPRRAVPARSCPGPRQVSRTAEPAAAGSRHGEGLPIPPQKLSGLCSPAWRLPLPMGGKGCAARSPLPVPRGLSGPRAPAARAALSERAVRDAPSAGLAGEQTVVTDGTPSGVGNCWSGGAGERLPAGTPGTQVDVGGHGRHGNALFPCLPAPDSPWPHTRARRTPGWSKNSPCQPRGPRGLHGSFPPRLPYRPWSPGLAEWLFASPKAW